MSDRYESAALLDFVATVVWPSRTVAVVDAAQGQSVFPILGTWDVATDMPMAWVNGRRVTGTISWAATTAVILPVVVPRGAQVIILVTPGAGTGYLPRTGLVAMLGDLLMGGRRICNMHAAVEAGDAVRFDQVGNLVTQLLGGNYIAKRGDAMTGPLSLAAASFQVGPAAALRRDMAALLAADATVAERTFLNRPRALPTQDDDHDDTLVTKGWFMDKYRAFLSLAQPNRSQYYTAPGPQTFSVPADVTSLFVVVTGGGGGSGGDQERQMYTGFPAYHYAGASGGQGGSVYARVLVTPLTDYSLEVGGYGRGGATDDESSGGGGGGGASHFDHNVIAGGGGGGGGATGAPAWNVPSPNPGAGGAGGVNGSGTGGGAAGTGGTAQGGAGGSPGYVGLSGGSTRGTGEVSSIGPDPASWPGNPGAGQLHHGGAASPGAIAIFWSVEE